MNTDKIKIHIGILYMVVAVVISISGWLYLKRSKIAYVNSGLLLEKYQGMKESRSLTDQKIGVWQSQLDTLVARFENNIKGYKNNYDRLSNKQREVEENKLKDEERQLNSYKKQLEELIAKEEEKNTSGVLNQINSYIKQYSEDQGYDLVLGITSSGNILYGSEAVDITEEVVEGLNKEYKK